VDPRVEGLSRLGIYVALPHDASETDLHMLAWTAESIVQIEVAEGGVKIVTPHQTDRAFPEPDAFGAGSGARHGTARVSDFVDVLRGGVLGGVAGFGGFEGFRINVLSNQREHERTRPQEGREATPNDKHGRTVCCRPGLAERGMQKRVGRAANLDHDFTSRQ
jgi:hypothetical protein